MNDQEQHVSNKLTNKQIAIRAAISFAALGLISLIVLWSVYDFEWSLDTVSNSVFIVNVPVFLVAVVMQTGATRVTIGMTYATRMFFTYRKMKEEYDGYGEYYDEKSPGHTKNMVYIMIAAGLWIAIAFILSAQYLADTPNF